MANRTLRPVFFGDFHCTAADCVSDCCHGLAIFLSKNEYERVRGARVPKALEERIRQGVKRTEDPNHPDIYGAMPLNSTGRCPLQEENGLCALQSACGPQVLPDVCREFPRQQLRARARGYQQQGCTLACGEVIRLLMHLPQGIEFEWIEGDTAPDTARTVGNVGSEYLHELMDLSIGVLQDRQFTLDERVILLGMAMKELEGIIQNGQISAIPAWSTRQARLLSHSAVRQGLDQITPNPQVPMLNSLRTLLICRHNRWFPEIVEQVSQNLGLTFSEKEEVSGDYKDYLARREQSRQNRLLDGMFWENLLVDAWFTSAFPFFFENVWRSFLHFCSYYSFMKYMAVGYLGEGSTERDVLYLFSSCSRVLLHNHRFAKMLADQLQLNESATLAHMALLVKD